MENEDELINMLKEIKSDVSSISFCVLLVTGLITLELILSMVP